MTPALWTLIKGFVVIGGFSAVLIVLLELRERHSFKFLPWLRSCFGIVRKNIRGQRLGRFLGVSAAIKRVL